MRYNTLIVCLFLALSACMKDELLQQTDPPQVDSNTRGLFIVCEGNFMYDNASLSYYDIDNQRVYNDVFYNSNEALPLGDVAQSMVIRDSLAYIVLNNSGKVYIISTKTFRYVGKIIGLTSPRYMHFLSDTKAYITDLYAKAITVINPQTNSIVGYIDASNTSTEFYQHPTEQMVQYGQYVFTNCWSYDNKILVIDTEIDSVVYEIEVLKQPTALVLDKNDKLWTITDGGYESSPYGHEAPGLIRIDAATWEVEQIFRFEKGDRPSGFCLNATGDTLYFINRHIWRMPITANQLPEQSFIESPYTDQHAGGYHGIAVDPLTSDLYVADAIDNVQPGIIYRYNAQGIAIDTFKVGITPGAFCFRPE